MRKYINNQGLVPLCCSDFQEQGKIGVDELPRKGSTRRAKELFEHQPMAESERTSHGVTMVSEGVATASRKKFESGMVSNTMSGESRQMDDLPEVSTMLYHIYSIKRRGAF